MASAASIAGSQCNSIVSSSRCLANGIGNLLGFATGILIGVAIIWYFWGIIMRMWDVAQGSAKDSEPFKNQLLYGLGAIFVILSIWGILALMGNLFLGTSNFNSLF